MNIYFSCKQWKTVEGFNASWPKSSSLFLFNIDKVDFIFINC